MKKLTNIQKAIKTTLVASSMAAGFFGLFQFLRSEFVRVYWNLQLDMVLVIAIAAVGAIILGIILYLLADSMILGSSYLYQKAESNLYQKNTSTDILFGISGLAVGLLLATLLRGALIAIPFVGELLVIPSYALLGLFCMRVFQKKIKDFLPEKIIILDEMTMGTTSEIKEKKLKKLKQIEAYELPKILDTSVIIDGRIGSIARTGFIDGVFIIPSFVLEELRYIADSGEDIKRVRGRYGLDVLKSMQEDKSLDIVIWEGDFPEIHTVDDKLIKLATSLKGALITNDYNLNKMASIKGLKVLNINELANSLKAYILPGEKLKVSIVKQGKEMGQGVAYLDDGTMIVVENGRKAVGSDMEVVVTSILQTAAGRMIFSKIMNS